MYSLFLPFFEQRLAQKAGTLSGGGEQKMLIIARALMRCGRACWSSTKFPKGCNHR